MRTHQFDAIYFLENAKIACYDKSRIQCIYSTYILELYSQISNDGGVWTEVKSVFQMID